MIEKKKTSLKVEKRFNVYYIDKKKPDYFTFYLKRDHKKNHELLLYIQKQISSISKWEQKVLF